jgi:hypothetical protein
MVGHPFLEDTKPVLAVATAFDHHHPARFDHKRDQRCRQARIREFEVEVT